MTCEHKIQKLIKRLKRGWTSPIDALNDCGLFSLSQRVGQLRQRGYNIADQWATSPTGSRFKRYRIVSTKKVAAKELEAA